MKKSTWLYYAIHNYIRQRFNMVMKRLKIRMMIKPKHRDMPYLSVEDTHNKIKEIIMAGKPALIARFGSVEASCIAEAIGIDLGIKKRFSDSNLYALHNNAGVFPYGADMAHRFSMIAIDAAKQVDLLGAWSSSMQDFLIQHVCSKDMLLTFLGGLEPYYSKHPWSGALKGKKVLVIHPFKESIESQYQKRELLFPNPEILPEFDLKVLRAVQTIAGEKDDRFEDWEEALEYMHREAMKEDFDVAIIGCGAYGMPLAAKIKESGKIAIHLGGATQLLFGIKGARWENHPLSKIFNEHWVRPADSEKPRNAQKVEGACYW